MLAMTKSWGDDTEELENYTLVAHDHNADVLKALAHQRDDYEYKWHWTDDGYEYAYRVNDSTWPYIEYRIYDTGL